MTKQPIFQIHSQSAWHEGLNGAGYLFIILGAITLAASVTNVVPSQGLGISISLIGGALVLASNRINSLQAKEIFQKVAILSALRKDEIYSKIYAELATSEICFCENWQCYEFCAKHLSSLGIAADPNDTTFQQVVIGLVAEQRLSDQKIMTFASRLIKSPLIKNEYYKIYASVQANEDNDLITRRAIDHLNTAGFSPSQASETAQALLSAASVSYAISTGAKKMPPTKEFHN